MINYFTHKIKDMAYGNFKVKEAYYGSHKVYPDEEIRVTYKIANVTVKYSQSPLNFLVAYTAETGYLSSYAYLLGDLLEYHDDEPYAHLADVKLSILSIDDGFFQHGDNDLYFSFDREEYGTTILNSGNYNIDWEYTYDSTRMTGYTSFSFGGNVITNSSITRRLDATTNPTQGNIPAEETSVAITAKIWNTINQTFTSALSKKVEGYDSGAVVSIEKKEGNNDWVTVHEEVAATGNTVYVTISENSPDDTRASYIRVNDLAQQSPAQSATFEYQQEPAGVYYNINWYLTGITDDDIYYKINRIKHGETLVANIEMSDTADTYTAGALPLNHFYGEVTIEREPSMDKMKLTVPNITGNINLYVTCNHVEPTIVYDLTVTPHYPVTYQNISMSPDSYVPMPDKVEKGDFTFYLIHMDDYYVEIFEGGTEIPSSRYETDWIDTDTIKITIKDIKSFIDIDVYSG